MLVVDSPFPPYSPVEVDLKVKPDFGDMSTANSVRAGVSWRWHDEDGVTHRDGDFPASIYPSLCCDFIKRDVAHRIAGYAEVLGYVNGAAQGRFHLYGVVLEEHEFSKIHRWAIDYKVPLWVSVLAECHGVDLDEFNDADSEAIELLNSTPAEWLLKLWGVGLKEWNAKSFFRVGVSFTHFLADMNKVLEHERKEFNLVSS